jgi:membrane protein
MRGKIITSLSDGYRIIRRALKKFGSDRPVELAGFTAYFAIFSMVPIIIIIISVFGTLMGDMVIRERLFEELNSLVGQENTRILENAIENYEISEKSRIGTIIGALFFLFSATTLFSMMQRSFNYIWRIRIKSNLKMGLLNLAKTRLLSFGIILILGLVLLIFLIADTIILLFRDFLTNQIGNEFIIIARVANILVPLAVVATACTLIYRLMPDVRVKWRACWFGGIFTAILFAIGQLGINTAIGNTNLGEVYGTASSFVIILIWIYFASIILYFGAELTLQYSRFYNHDNKPANFAAFFEINKL